MRILNNDSGSAVGSVTIYLTRDEAEEVMRSIAYLLETPTEHHVHVNDSEYHREITIAVYSQANLLEFDERSRQLIQEGT